MLEDKAVYNEILLFVQSLSKRICDYLNVPLPKIFITVFPQGIGFEGSMVVHYNKKKMYINLYAPQNVSLNKNKGVITAILIHEHWHYYEYYIMSNSTRVPSLKEYMVNLSKRQAEEKRTWRGTKKVAKELSLWTKSVFKELKQCTYSSDIKF